MSASSAHDGLVPMTFGELLRFLRRRARLTQRDLGIAVGYSEAHINRFEKDKRLPDPSTVAALFVPALDLKGEPDLAQRLVELANPSERTVSQNEPHLTPLEAIPPAPPFETERAQTIVHLRERLSIERRVVLAGLPGVGKTMLAAALAREYSTIMPVFWLTLTEGVTTFVDTLVYQLAVFLLAHGHDQVRSLVQPLTPQPQLPLDRRLAVLAAALNREPSLLCFDNAELITQNDAALQVLHHLSATTSSFILLTSRESLPLKQFTELPLSGLDRAEGLAFIACLSDDQIPSSRAERLLEKTDGNPMLLRLAISQSLGEHAEVAFVDQLEAHPQVTAYLLETVQKQSSPSEWRLLSLLAVFQRAIDLCDEYLIDQMQTLKETRGAATAIADLQRRHLIDHPNHAGLHPLIRDYVYRALAAEPMRRRCLHRLAAEWYAERVRDTLSAAFHFAAGGLRDEAVELLMHDEKGIIARGQVLAAVSILDDILAKREKHRTMPDDQLCRLLAIRGDLLTTTLRGAEAEDSYRHALTLATNPAVRADIVCRMATVLLQRGCLDDVLGLARKARAMLEPTDRLLMARLLAQESRVLEMQSQHEAAQVSGEQALALANELDVISPTSAHEIRSLVYATLANVARYHRLTNAAIEYAQRGLVSARHANLRMREISLLSFIGGLMYDSGDLDGSLQYRQEALEGAQAIEDQVGIGYYLTHLAAIDYVNANPTAALEKLDRAIRILEDAGDIRGLASALSSRATHLLWQGNSAAARTTIQRVLNEMHMPVTRRSWGYYLNKRAMVELAEGEIEAAQSALCQALALPFSIDNPMLRFELNSNLALAQAAAGNAAAAQATLNSSPPFDGLSIWTKLDRNLVESCVIFAMGQVDDAYAFANQIVEQSQEYPRYAQAASRLVCEFSRTAPVSTLPHLLWVA